VDTVKVGKKEIGGAFPCYIISEIGNNHGVNIETAKKMIKVSYEVGADAVKFQTFKATDIVNPKVPANAYLGWDVSDKFEYWHEFVDTLAMPYEWYDELINYAKGLGIGFISTPASLEAARFLAEKGVDALKIASMDLNNIPFLEEIARMGLPVILSTGMATVDEIQDAVATLKKSPLVLLHCVSNYPLKHEDANLLNIKMIKDRFHLPVGFSNHALGYDLDIAAVTLGAKIIEKHFTLNRSDPNLAEHHFSMESEEMRELVENIKLIEKALGNYERGIAGNELENRKLSRRSITILKEMKPGDRIEKKNITMVRPGTGIEPRHLDEIIGRKVCKRIEAFELLKWEDLEC